MFCIHSGHYCVYKGTCESFCDTLRKIMQSWKSKSIFSIMYVRFVRPKIRLYPQLKTYFCIMRGHEPTKKAIQTNLCFIKDVYLDVLFMTKAIGYGRKKFERKPKRTNTHFLLTHTNTHSYIYFQKERKTKISNEIISNCKCLC